MVQYFWASMSSVEWILWDFLWCSWLHWIRKFFLSLFCKISCTPSNFGCASASASLMTIGLVTKLVTGDDQFRLCNLHCEKFSRSHSCRLLEDNLVLGFYVTLKCSPSPLSLSLLLPSLPPTWLFMLLLPSSLIPITISSIFSSHGDAVILT